MIQEQISFVKVKNGIDGDNGLTSYTHIAWANSSDGRKDFSLTESLGKKYEGTYTDFTEGASTDPSKYKWIESANVFRDEVEAAKQAGYEAKDKAYEAKIESGEAVKHANQIATETGKQITDIQGDILLRVKKDDVINQINVSGEGILIDGVKTHITGETTIDEGVIDTAYIKDAAITSAKIKDVTADKIKAGKVTGLVLSSISETGRFSVEGQHAILENTDTGFKTEIYDDGIYTYNGSNVLRARFTEDMVNSNKFGTSTKNVYLATGGLDGEESQGGEVRTILYTRDVEEGNDVGSKYEYIYRPLRTDGVYTRFVQANEAIDGVYNLYLRTPNGQEVRVTASGTTDNYQDFRAQRGFFSSIVQEQPDGGNFYIGANSEVRMTSRGGYNGDATIYRDIRAQDARIASIIQKDTGYYFYIGTGEGLRVTSRAGYNGGNINYKPVQARSFNNASLASLKTEISKRTESALKSIEESDIYDYKLKGELAEGNVNNHIGLVIGEGYNTPDCVQNDDKTAIDVYSMTSVAWQAIQELSNKNEILNDRISDLQSEIDILKGVGA